MTKASSPGVPLRSLRGGALHFCGRLLIGAAALAFAAGCPDKPPPSAQDAQPPNTPGSSVGVRVPLPRGWVAQADNDVLAIGPPGRTVLRVIKTDKTALPSLESLQHGFGAGLEGVRATTVEEVQKPDVVLWRARLTPQEGDSWTALVGARRLEGGVYLCATDPGATENEVKQAADACAALGR